MTEFKKGMLVRMLDPYQTGEFLVYAHDKWGRPRASFTVHSGDLGIVIEDTRYNNTATIAQGPLTKVYIQRIGKVVDVRRDDIEEA